MTFVYLSVIYLGGNDLCGVTLNLYPQLAQCEYTLRITPQTPLFAILFCMQCKISGFQRSFSDQLFSICRYMYA